MACGDGGISDRMSITMSDHRLYPTSFENHSFEFDHCFHDDQMYHSSGPYHRWLQEDAVGTQPRVVFMHKCMQLESWPATAIVSQLHLAHINLSYVIMDSKSRPAPLLQ